MTTEEREDRALTRFVQFLALALALTIGLWMGNTWPVHSEPAPEPDWTVASCTEWADTAAPVLPRYTREDVCAVRTASGAWYISTPTGEGNPALTAPVTR